MTAPVGAAAGRFAVVVDPLSTGAEYPAAFRAAGVETVAVLSRRDVADVYLPSWRPDEFRHVHVLEGVRDPRDVGDVGDVDGLAARLAPFEPLCVVPGAECGVALADALVERLTPGSGNVAALSLARRDKTATADALVAAGVPCLRSVRATSPADVDAWLDATGLRGSAIVLKPPASSGTDNVHVVGPGEDWLRHFRQIHGRRAEDGHVNDAVVVQEFADGVEYIVDSYSVDGEHVLVDVCRYTKVRRGDRLGVYDLVDFVEPDHADVAAVWPYTRRVLDAIGVRNGCCHSEVIVTRDGPRVVDVGARPTGGGHQMITALATGTNHIGRTVSHRVRGVAEPSYELVRHVCSVVISAPHDGVWRNPEVFDDVDELPTFHSKHFYFGRDDVVPAPAGMATFVGWVVLVAADRASMERDYRAVKDRERRMRVEPAGPIEPSGRPAATVSGTTRAGER